MSRRVWLVRHASTDWTGVRWCGSTDLGLNAHGRVEAERLAASVSARIAAGTALLSSPSRRALETAAPLETATGSTARIDDRLREVDFGDVEGLDWSELESRHPGIATAVAAGERWVDWPGGESAAEVRARAAGVWSEVARGPDDVIVVSHGGFIRAVLGVALTGARKQPDLGPGSVVELQRRATGWAIAS